MCDKIVQRHVVCPFAQQFFFFSLHTTVINNEQIPDRCAKLTDPLLFSTAGQYLFQPPNHYIFHGAEVYSDSEDETSSSCGSDSEDSECCAEGEEDDSEPEDVDVVPAVDGETCLKDIVQHTVATEATSSVQTDNNSEKTESTTHL